MHHGQIDGLTTPVLMKNRFYKPGPGALITAAFIGPGTITTCSLAGARFGYALIWGLVFSVIATIVLQEMAARLGVITQQGLGEALRKHFNKLFPRLITSLLVISAIAIGNAAFEAGNIMGAALGIEALSMAKGTPGYLWILIIGTVTFAILFTGSYPLIEKVLIGLVILMSLTFLTTAILAKPNISSFLHGMFIPGIPSGSLLPLLGLIGTTVVPYNLFLYASAVRERWSGAAQLPQARSDTFFSIAIGGMVSIAIVVSAAVAFFNSGTTPESGSDLALQLQPLLGSWSKYFIGAGLFAAGISSAITAPLAAAWATSGVFGWERNMRSWKFRMVWMGILLAGIVFAVMGFKPIEVILFAQAANGILLPVIAIYLLWIMNSARIMGQHTNAWLSNTLGGIVVLVVIALSTRTLLMVFGVI